MTGGMMQRCLAASNRHNAIPALTSYELGICNPMTGKAVSARI